MAQYYIICLKYRNITFILREWSYSEYIPEIYYYYDLPLKPMKFKYDRKIKNLVIYKRETDDKN